MEAPIPARGIAPDTAGFRETPGGGVLSMDRSRSLAPMITMGAFAITLGLGLLYASTLATPNGNAGGQLGLELGGVVMFLLAAVFIAGLLLQGGGYELSADEAGVQLVRRRWRPRIVPWSQVTRIEYGATAVRMGRYGSRLADAICIDAGKWAGPIFLDTARFRVPADDMDRMAAVLKDLGGRHGIPVEPFPMAGRETR